MSIYVFLGPTLSVARAREELEAVYLPPVAQGDIFRLAREMPTAIGIIDGYFGTVPSVWHKELLWAMSKGIHLYGSASIGALRAAETSAFGMIGVGTIFAAFQNGALEDDDEVAVAHLPHESGYKKLSTAMVNIRATVRAAVAAEVIRAQSGMVLEKTAKSLYYPERCYETILLRVRDSGVSAREIESFKHWLPRGEVDQKAEDATEMLRVMWNDAHRGLARKKVKYHFEFAEMCAANESLKD